MGLSPARYMETLQIAKELSGAACKKSVSAVDPGVFKNQEQADARPNPTLPRGYRGFTNFVLSGQSASKSRKRVL